jgi:ParB family chromosome partitioning protein
MLTHDRITVRPQVRRTFPKADMDELRASIREIRAQNGGIEGSGVLQALLVSPLHDESGALIGYRLIAGEKRFRATQAEDVPEVPCIVIPEASEPVVRLMQLTENAQRTPPPVLDEALAIRDTMQELNLSLRDMGRMMGKSLGYVTERVGLLKMGEDVQEMVFARANTPGIRQVLLL